MLSGSLRTEHRVILWTVLELVGGKSDYLLNTKVVACSV
jgi:hypothetical protein